MGKLLYIKANAKPDEKSRTFRISNSFIEEYKLTYPDDEIITLDLYREGIKFLTEKDINELFAPKTAESRNHPILKYAYQFAEADKYVIAAPMWNLSFPAILKAYLDYICVAGITFKYTEHGSVGLCKGKKALYIVTRGGDYSHAPSSDLEMGARYLRTLFAFLGIEDFEVISADKLDIQGEDVEAILQSAIDKAKEKVRSFGEMVPILS